MAPARKLFACDTNLGFPSAEPYWQDFFVTHDCRVGPYADLDRLADAIRSNEPRAAYLPAAKYFFLKSNPAYEGIAIALSASSRSPRTSSVLIVNKSGPIATLAQLHGKRVGHVHPYCTSSDCALAMLLHQNGYSMKDFFSEIVAVGAWQEQIDAVVAGSIDATMVHEDVWTSTSQNAATTRIVGRINNLPAPLIIAEVDCAFSSALRQSLMSYPGPAHATGALFSGFAPSPATKSSASSVLPSVHSADQIALEPGPRPLRRAAHRTLMNLKDLA